MATAAAERRADRGGLCKAVEAQPHFVCFRDEFLAEMTERREKKTGKRFQWIEEHIEAFTAPCPD
jgi:hypothetical protein